MENLIKIQTEIKVSKDKENTFGKYKYRNCESICEALKPLLKKYNCCITMYDDLSLLGENLVLTANIVFQDPSNNFIMPVKSSVIVDDHKGMSTEQECGSASSYARKYALSGLLLLDDNQDPDEMQPKQENQLKSVDTLKKELAKIESVEELSAWKNANIKQMKGELRAFAIAKFKELTAEQDNESTNN